jgi:para-aminobenzoate synthetase component 1
MTTLDFINRVNYFSSSNQPFFFLIDFEKKKPVVFSLEEAKEQGVLFAIKDTSNVSQEAVDECNLNLNLKKPKAARYEKAFKKVQEHLFRGDSYLVNLTFPTEVNFDGNLKDLFYQSISPYKLLYKDDFVSYSPECFVKIIDGKIFSYPMKGTISSSVLNAQEKVLNNPKEIAEHATIVDLIRNDLSTYAKEVRVNRFRYIDQIQTEDETLLQVSSEIEGVLKSDWKNNLGSLLWDMLPAGSISGAPKKKTLEIIKSVEDGERGYYTGIYGFFDGTNLDSAVAIRFLEKKDNSFFYRSGGGITAQSNCKEEFQELLDKIYVPTV